VLAFVLRPKRQAKTTWTAHIANILGNGRQSPASSPLNDDSEKLLGHFVLSIGKKVVTLPRFFEVSSVMGN
jgi:hypothetical protein